LIAAVAGGDHDSRIVYLDWLEQHEARERIEYLRLDDQLDEMPIYHPLYASTHDRHRQLEDLDPVWCEQVGRAYIRARLQDRVIRAAITAEDPVAFDDLARLASRFRQTDPSPSTKPWRLPDQLQYLEALHASANARRRR
jgi:uncharacterized protein (TIGR02996 family)